MKILLSAYSCGALMTSEPGVAWRAVNHALSRGHEVWTVTERSGYEEPMMHYLAKHPMPGFHPVFMDLASAPLKALRRSGPLGSVYYHLWQQKLVSVARDLHEKVGFDLAQHVTFVRYWTPSGLRNLGIPFIWGPVGAAESAPPSFLAELPFRDRVFEFARNNVRAVSRIDPCLRATARASTIAVGTTRESCAAIRELGARQVEQLPLCITDEELAVFDTFPPPPDGPFRAMCLGRLLHWKGFYLAIRAFSLFAKKDPKAELWIVGSGPFQAELEKTVLQTGMTGQVRFLGHLTHAGAMEKLAQVHVLIHPALHENFPGVCIEAMAAGRPVVCLDIGGPAVQVTPETGFIAAPTTPAEAVAEMAGFLTRISGDRELLRKMSLRARARVREEFTMRKIGAAIDSLYERAVAMHGKSGAT
jgi:glycosyltransferase involved in cell wall biosynthesis